MSAYNNMVFNPPTLLNYTNADLYAYERRKIQQYNYFLRYKPHIMSHTYIEISYNAQLTDNDELPWYRKIRFTVRSRKKFCSQTSCQLHYPRGNTCTTKDEPRIFKTGDHDLEACQFGCYNLYDMATMPSTTDKDEKTTTSSSSTDPPDEQYARAPFLIYSYKQCACTQHNNGLFALGADDYTRTDYHPMPRIDTIGTGFHYIDSGNFFERKDFSSIDNQPYVDNEGNESFRFNINRYYCDDFQLKFDGRKCYQSVGEQIFGFLVSSTLYKACQYGVRYAATGVTNTDVQKLSLPPPKYQVHHSTLNSWLNDVDPDAFFINPNVTLEDLGFREDKKHCIFTTEYGYPGRLIEPLAQNTGWAGSTVDYGKLNEGRLHQFKYDPETGQRLIDEYEIYGIYQYIRSNPTNNTFDEDSYAEPDRKLADMFNGIINNMGELGAMLTFGYLLDKGVQYSQKVLGLSVEFLEGKITPTLLHIVERELLTQSFHPVIRIFTKAIASIVRTTSSLIKTVDIFTTIAGILDLIDLGVDFFSMNRVMDNGTIQQYSQLDIDTLRKAYGYGTVEYSPVTFMLMCEYLKIHEKWNLTPTATTKLRCLNEYTKYKYMIPIAAAIRYDTDNDNAYEWVSEYIFSLRVNSNGLNINWEDEGKLPSDVIDQYLKIDENVYLKGMDEYSKYTESFRKRIKYSQYALLVIVILFVLILIVYTKIATPFIFVAAIGAYYLVFSYIQ